MMLQKIANMPFWKFIVLFIFTIFLIIAGLEFYIASRFLAVGYKVAKVFEDDAKEELEERQEREAERLADARKQEENLASIQALACNDYKRLTAKVKEGQLLSGDAQLLNGIEDSIKRGYFDVKKCLETA